MQSLFPLLLETVLDKVSLVVTRQYVDREGDVVLSHKGHLVLLHGFSINICSLE